MLNGCSLTGGCVTNPGGQNALYRIDYRMLKSTKKNNERIHT